MLLLLLVLALSASPAEASTLWFGSGAYTYTGTAGDDMITIAGEFVFTDPAGIDVQGEARSRGAAPTGRRSRVRPPRRSPPTCATAPTG